jgi:hypothetical protein
VLAFDSNVQHFIRVRQSAVQCISLFMQY